MDLEKKKEEGPRGAFLLSFAPRLGDLSILRFAIFSDLRPEIW
jgi:hypothetical protein